jgi:hypothetical protein
MDEAQKLATIVHKQSTITKKPVEYNGIQKELFTNVKSNKLESRNTL